MPGDIAQDAVEIFLLVQKARIPKTSVRIMCFARLRFRELRVDVARNLLASEATDPAFAGFAVSAMSVDESAERSLRSEAVSRWTRPGPKALRELAGAV